MIPLKTKRRQISSGLYFCQETVDLGVGRFTNLYWVEMDRQYKFKLISETSPIPLQKFQLSDKKVMAGINFGSFFLSDDLVSPYVAFYNLLVTNGQILQPPSNSRSALSTHDGDLGLILTASSGIVKVGGNSFTWSCSKNRHSSDLIVYGMSDLTIVKSSQRNGTSKRKIVEDTRFIKCNIDELFVVVKLNDGIPVVSEITKNVVDLTKCAYTLKGHASLFAKCSVGMTISCLEIEKQKLYGEIDICSASFCLGKTYEELKTNLFNHLVYPADGAPKPMSENYLKSWSVVLKTKDNVAFFINDARPKIKSQTGISVFELQDILKERFEYEWACVGDSGQSSKLMVINGDTKEIYGNMHYQNYRGQTPVWDGLNGRPIPVALLAYE